MSLLSPLVGGVVGGGGVVDGGVGVAVAVFMIAGVGAGQALAQGCDPVEVAKLLAADGSDLAEFGVSVSIDGDTAVIGARLDADNGTNAGSAYVFTRSGGSGGVWTQQAKLLADDRAADDQFGWSVSVSGDTAVIGAYEDDDNGTLSGSAYVFTRSGGVWAQQAKLLADDGAQGDNLGWSVSISGNTAVIGAHGDDDSGSSSGSAYVFTRSGGEWSQQAKLLANDGARSGRFGFSVALNGNTALIGAIGDDENGPDSGSAYVFLRSGGVWSQQSKLLPADGAKPHQFGWVVAISGDRAVIGATFDSDNGRYSGAAYVFAREGGVWTEQAKLFPDNGEAGTHFGNTVALSGDTAVIGANGEHENGTNSGSAYVFTRSGGVWNQQAKLLPNDGEAHEYFGFSAALSGDTAVIGSFHDDDNGHRSGSAYVFDLGCIDCPADLNGDRFTDTRDFIAFLNAWANGDPLADWNDDGDINTLDFLAYLTDWTAGC